MPDLTDIAALLAAREWAIEHVHPQPDDRMLRTYGAALLRDFADFLDRGPTFPLPPSVFSALARERADDLTA
ncbi:hypothetical protein [Micromonospora endolithica]|uniref:Uncharacterized protein n=1 Tax=Micromonospora endolithica TaxID=230091 RepID=A0A3A9YT81_9ACTN|nr:hypothetical protein [Micromonospora endolithica]RKN38466.1 hypothetical protein D7223_31170 [Micromonospora endolithica]TWJ23111.1 hypothetical protein JD76_03240 [Micromonospora endolithica]